MYITYICVLSNFCSPIFFKFKTELMRESVYRFSPSLSSSLIHSCVIYIYKIFTICKFITFIWLTSTEILPFLLTLNLFLSLDSEHIPLNTENKMNSYWGKGRLGDMIPWYCAEFPPLHGGERRVISHLLPGLSQGEGLSHLLNTTQGCNPELGLGKCRLQLWICHKSSLWLWASQGFL